MNKLFMFLVFVWGETGAWAQSQNLLPDSIHPIDVKYFTQNWNAEGDSIEEIPVMQEFKLPLTCRCIKRGRPLDSLVFVINSKPEYHALFDPSCAISKNHDGCVSFRDSLPPFDFKSCSMVLTHPFLVPSLQPTHNKLEYKFGVNHTKRHYFLEITLYRYGKVSSIRKNIDGTEEIRWAFALLNRWPHLITLQIPKILHPEYEVKTIFRHIYVERDYYFRRR